MDIVKKIMHWNKTQIVIRWHVIKSSFVLCILLSMVIASCDSDPYDTQWVDEEKLTISQYLEKNQTEYSKSYRLLVEGKLLNSLYGYNPYGDDYTLFLPTDEAIDSYVEQNQDYENFEEMLLDTSFIYNLIRYHALKRKVHTDEFPDGALTDSTLSGERLAFGFYSDGDNPIIKVNNEVPIIKSNLEMTNGYIHVVSKVLQRVEIWGYDWLQQQEDYSILASAIELTGIKWNLWWNKYTILAEHDSVYHRNGIYSVEDLTDRLSSLRISNSLYKYAGYHIVGGEFYLNDLHWGNKKYVTMGGKNLKIDVGFEIKINPEIDTYGIAISESGDTTVIDYIRPIREDCNIVTRTGPIHSISDLLFYEPIPE